MKEFGLHFYQDFMSNKGSIVVSNIMEERIKNKDRYIKQLKYMNDNKLKMICRFLGQKKLIDKSRGNLIELVKLLIEEKPNIYQNFNHHQNFTNEYKDFDNNLLDFKSIIGYQEVKLDDIKQILINIFSKLDQFMEKIQFFYENT